MIGQIGPFVQAGEIGRRHTLLHLAGGALGGVILGSVTAMIGSGVAALIPEIAPMIGLLALAGVLVFGALSDLGILRLSNVGTQHQTPGVWSCSFGVKPALFAWGLDLGLLIRTRIPLQTALAIPAVGLLTGDLLLSLAATVPYGVGKAMLVAMTATRPDGQFTEACNIYDRTAGRARACASATGLVLAVVLVAAMTLEIGELGA